MRELTTEERVTNDATREHIALVGKNIHTLVRELLTRAENHDATKLKTPEVEAFTEVTPLLAASTYGSPEYDAFKKQLGEALTHHYANNRHHPEHFKRGMHDMNLVDLLELFCDWAASCKRHNDGNLHKSIEINAKRFDMPPMLVSIFENSVQLFE